VRSYADADALAAAMGVEGDLVTPRMGRGCRAFAGWIDGRPAGYGWLTAGPEWIGEADAEILPGPGEAYLWNCVTSPEHRLQGVFRGLVAHVCAVAAAEEMPRLWIASLSGTAESAVEELGFRPVLRLESAPSPSPARRH
jgi:GNAT superfamily N-acetyltransferase